MSYSFDPYIISMIIVFFLGYALITLEHVTRINKATIALLMAILCWILQFANQQWTGEENLEFLGHHVANVSQVVFFLLGAMTVVEIINVHKGFQIIADLMKTRSKRTLLWIMCIITFFLSSILDNLTTTIVMVSLLQKIMKKSESRLIIGGGIVIAANAGGAWSPIGDVTTTMLWIGGQLSTIKTMIDLFLPSIICLVSSTAALSLMLKGEFQSLEKEKEQQSEPLGNFVFFLGIGVLMFVPIFKILTGLPPFMGILFGLSVLWLVTDIVHCKYDDRDYLRVPYVLSKVDLSSVLFFLGILLCIDALQTAKILEQLAKGMDYYIGNTVIVATLIGLASAVVDNVPLVAASMGMYSLEHYPMDSQFWQLIALCAGTGGSILIIGSAAGVVFMGLEKADFYWFLKKISLSATVGYFMGIGAYLLLV